MEMDTEAGLKLRVANSEGGKIIAFERPTAAIELTLEEARRLAYVLGKEKQAKLSQAMLQLVNGGYFAQPKSFSEIRETLQGNGMRVRSASLHVLVTNLVERGTLKRNGERRSFTYAS
jgi:hypothetical protein